MIKVAGCWELGYNTPIMEYDLWHFPLRDFGVDEFIMTPVSGIDREVTEYKLIQDAIDANPILIPVFVDEKGSTELRDFEHPKDALYILGNAGNTQYKNTGISLKVKTVANDALLWPHQAICIVLYDRMQKWQ